MHYGPSQSLAQATFVHGAERGQHSNRLGVAGGGVMHVGFACQWSHHNGFSLFAVPGFRFSILYKSDCSLQCDLRETSSNGIYQV
jgi:hypothetical protein